MKNKNITTHDADSKIPVSKQPETTVQHKCPLGGNIENDCADCAYAGDYHYDYAKQDCVLRDS